MDSVLILGSGPAAAGTALALSNCPDLRITVLDVGLELEPDRRRVVERMGVQAPGEWTTADIDMISVQPVKATVRGVPEKRMYASDYPFRDVGQLAGISVEGDVTASLVSGAYGGFSTTWGSHLMPFPAAVFDDWPFGLEDLLPHYRAILAHIPYAAEHDDLASMFPLLGLPCLLPPLSPRSERVLGAYQRHREKLNDHGVIMGKSRLAFRADACVRCGLCMTGCPYQLIYSSAQTFDALRRTSPLLQYRHGLLAVSVSQRGGKVRVLARDKAGSEHYFDADRAYIACGAVGTTRLVAASLGLQEDTFTMLESQQFILPMLSARGVEDPRNEPFFTLSQFNMVLSLGGMPGDVCQLHFYTFNQAFSDALPALLKSAPLRAFESQLLRRLSVAFGFLPSWRSPCLQLSFRGTRHDGLPRTYISRGRVPRARNGALIKVARALGQSARLLDLYPVMPMLRLAGGGRSYHWGGTFPHGGDRSSHSSDRLGRVEQWDRVHLVDGSVLPGIPGCSTTLTIMANAHRIASESLELRS